MVRRSLKSGHLDPHTLSHLTSVSAALAVRSGRTVLMAGKGEGVTGVVRRVVQHIGLRKTDAENHEYTEQGGEYGNGRLPGERLALSQCRRHRSTDDTPCGRSRLGPAAGLPRPPRR